MEQTAKIGFAIGSALIIWVLHRLVGTYPPPRERSARPGRDLRRALLLWLVALVTETLRVAAITPWLEQHVPDLTLRELVQVPLLSLPYLVLPLAVMLRDGWPLRDLGLTWKTRSSSVTAFALGFGILGGSVPFLTGQAVMGYAPLPAGVFVLLVYTNAFLEEFFHRGVIQSTLARAIGHGRAIAAGAVLFGQTHAAFDISRLAPGEGVAGVALAMLLQGMAGGLFGIVFAKTGSLWPGMVCHYLLNWLSAMLVAGSR